MDIKKIGAFIKNERKKLNLSQSALGEYLIVTDKAVSKWERGLSCPDIEILRDMAILFSCTISDILEGARRATTAQCYTENDAVSEFSDDNWSNNVTVSLNYQSTKFISPLLFGDNLEHTRGCVYGGLSAELLRNRKFVGKPGRYGCAHEWYVVGERTYCSFGIKGEYLTNGSPYTRHGNGYKMHRAHERNAQYITSYTDETAGFGQKDIYVTADTEYVCEIAIHADVETPVTIRLLGFDRSEYDAQTILARVGDYEEQSVILRSPKTDAEARLEITFQRKATVMIGAVSLMQRENFHGMRLDVIEKIKELGIRLLRWPGGNFAGEYHWKDGLLPRNMRAPFQSYLWLETQPHSYGYDFHEFNTDDFIALCREIGAEPFITINPTWNTPEESAQWVEYCNGDESTPYGKMRAERGHPEPYNVLFWSLGNEAGYGHMEGANTADAYAKVVRSHAQEMLKVTSGLNLCSSGPYPNKEWVDYSAKALSDIAGAVSLHHYTRFPSFKANSRHKENYIELVSAATDENCKFLRDFRAQLGNHPISISFDEWNAWYAWYRPGSVAEGIFAAAFQNMLFQNAERYGVMIACHFESVNEGAIKVYPDRAELSPVGQVFSLMKDHAGAMICALQPDVTATQKDGVVTCTLTNRSYDQEKCFLIAGCGKLISAKLYSSDDVVPGTVFSQGDIAVKADGENIEIVLPPHSIAQIKMNTPT